MRGLTGTEKNNRKREEGYKEGKALWCPCSGHRPQGCYKGELELTARCQGACFAPACPTAHSPSQGDVSVRCCAGMWPYDRHFPTEHLGHRGRASPCYGVLAPRGSLPLLASPIAWRWESTDRMHSRDRNLEKPKVDKVPRFCLLAGSPIPLWGQETSG